MTAPEIVAQIKVLSQHAKESGQPSAAKVLDLLAYGIEQDHADIMARLLEGARDAYLAGQRDCAKHSGCYK